ncbi:MAG: TetR/AcrR family transcriptional regulator, partial [Actinomycetota bacterium]|nr:TetR/AcrR family transcriptional regulator [Actinomycetota bacterium]
MPRQSDARDRMIRSAATLFRERGVEGTAFADVLEHSSTPRGSVYHHFPGGKQQLAEEATRWAGELMAAGIAASLQD